MVSRRLQPILAIGLLAVTIAIGIQYVVQTSSERRAAEHSRQVAECQARYNDAFARVLTARGKLADADRRSNRTLIRTAFTANSPAKVRTAMRRYLAAQRRLDVERAQHPYPKLPSRACR